MALETVKMHLSFADVILKSNFSQLLIRGIPWLQGIYIIPFVQFLNDWVTLKQLPKNNKHLFIW